MPVDSSIPTVDNSISAINKPTNTTSLLAYQGIRCIRVSIIDCHPMYDDGVSEKRRNSNWKNPYRATIFRLELKDKFFWRGKDWCWKKIKATGEFWASVIDRLSRAINSQFQLSTVEFRNVFPRVEVTQYVNRGHPTVNRPAAYQHIWVCIEFSFLLWVKFWFALFFLFN